MQPDSLWVNVSCRIPVVIKLSVSCVVCCSRANSAWKYFGSNSFPLSFSSHRVSTSSWSLAPIDHAAAPGVVGEDGEGSSEEGGVVGSAGAVVGGGVVSKSD